MDFCRLPQYPGEDSDPQPDRRGRQFSREDGLVETAVEIFLVGLPEDSNQALFAEFGKRGIEPAEAWRLHQFVPIAFTHVVLEKRGIDFQPGYVKWNPDSNVHTHHLLRDEPIYAAGVRSARRWLARGFTPDQLAPIFGLSSEWGVVRQFMGPNGDMRGIWLTEPLLVDFARDETEGTEPK